MVRVIHIGVVSEHHPFGPLGDQAKARLVHAARRLRRFIPSKKSQARYSGFELVALAGPSGNAFCQRFERNFQAAILKRLLDGLLAH
jgi:hypothetical protein